MTYQETIQWMFQQLPMYQNKGKKAYKKDLTNIQKLVSHLNHPELNFKSIHIGGTNGKGSTSHILASILQEANYKVGLYTSPHLIDFRERIKINGQKITKQYVIEFVTKNINFFKTNQLSFFEMTVGLAFDYFAKKKVDIAIIEVGLGGRLDSTNIITPLVAVITNIGLDHTDLLGNTHELIAIEKAGIIKPSVPVIIGETRKDTSRVFNTVAKANKADITYVNQEKQINFECDLKGSYQKKNIKTAIETVNILNQKNFSISERTIENGLKHVVKNTKLLGRWQVIQTQPTIICDTAHNQDGINEVVNQLKKEHYSKLHIVFGMVKGKQAEQVIKLLPKEATYYICQPNIERALEAEILLNLFQTYKLVAEKYLTVSEALNAALLSAKKNDLIFLGGSTFVVADFLSDLPEI